VPLKMCTCLASGSLLRSRFLRGELLSSGEGVGCLDFYVGLGAGAFPVGFGERVDGASERHADHEVVVNAMAIDWMGATTGSFADDGSALQIFEVVVELFCAGESVLRRQNECRFAIQAFARDIGQSPIFGP
jgi:hypothetical protein